MRRSYLNCNQNTDKPSVLPEGCIFYAPLSQNDMTDHVSGTTGVIGNGTFAWDSTYQAYKIKTTTGGQTCLKFNIPNRFDLYPDYCYTYNAKVFVESFSGTCDFLQLGTGTSDRDNAVSLAETHRYTGFTTGCWHWLSMTKSDTQVLFYIDGVIVRTDTTSTFPSLNCAMWNSWMSISDIAIGGGFNSYNYTAYIKEVSVFNRVLSVDELRLLQYEDEPVFYENLVFYAPLLKNDLTDHISGTVPTSDNSCGYEWDSTKGMYLLKAQGSSSSTYAALKYINLSLFSNGTPHTLVIDVDENHSDFTSTYTNRYNIMMTTPIRPVTSNFSAYSYIRHYSYDTTYSPIKGLHRYVMVWQNNNEMWYKDGVYFGNGSRDPLNFNSVAICQLNTNNSRNSIWAKNARIYNRALSAVEVKQL